MFSLELAVFLEFYTVRRGAPVLRAYIPGNTRQPALSTTCTLEDDLNSILFPGHFIPLQSWLIKAVELDV